MNQFNLDVTQRCLIAECWCPVEDLDEIQHALIRGTVSGSTCQESLKELLPGLLSSPTSTPHIFLPDPSFSTHTHTCAHTTSQQERSGSTVPSILNRMKTDDPPPTHFKTNKFTSGFQAIVDAYGIATYEEVNPSECSLWQLTSALSVEWSLYNAVGLNPQS